MAGRRFDNVFVLCTGRCGSLTFIRAASHATNFTAAHESLCHLTGPARFGYPSGHIEADNRLAWLLGHLQRSFGDDPLYIHLTRDPEETALSFAARADRGILLAYRTEILMRAAQLNPGAERISFCRDYVDTVNANIALFLKDRPHVERVALESGPEDFERVWARIGATGDLAAARAEWSVRHNATVVPNG